MITKTVSYPLIEVTGNISKQYSGVCSNCRFFINLHTPQIEKQKLRSKQISLDKEEWILQNDKYL